MQIISRAEWGAQPPKSPHTTFRPPASRTFLHHSVTSQYLYDVKAGARAIQQIAFSRGFNDISYSFLVFAAGQVAEGRGWGVVGGHTAGYNSTSHAICLVGNYENDHPSALQVDSVRWLIAEGKRLGKIAGGAPLDPHRSVSQTACPGAHALARLNDFRQPWSGSPTPQPEGFLMALTDKEQAELRDRVYNLHEWLDPSKGFQKPRDDSLRDIRAWCMRILAKVGG